MTDLDTGLRIVLLADLTEAIPILQQWFELEWAPYYGPAGPGDAQRDLQDSCNRDTLPLAMVALYGGEVCGTAALRAESVSTHKRLSPWLAALLVNPSFRQRGIGERLIAAIEEKARALGYDRTYVGTGKGTGTPESALRRRGWEYVEKGPYFVSEVSIFRKMLFHA